MIETCSVLDRVGFATIIQIQDNAEGLEAEGQWIGYLLFLWWVCFHHMSVDFI